WFICSGGRIRHRSHVDRHGMLWCSCTVSFHGLGNCEVPSQGRDAKASGGTAPLPTPTCTCTSVWVGGIYFALYFALYSHYTSGIYFPWSIYAFTVPCAGCFFSSSAPSPSFSH